MRKKIFVFISSVLFVSTFAFPQKVSTSAIQAVFQKHGFDGCFVYYDLNQDEVVTYNYKRAGQPFLPASTFKILNSLIAIETGVAPDQNLMIKWDGTKRSIDAWNQDLTLASAFRVSCLPCYQEIARRIGFEKMRKWVTLSQYGDMDIHNKNIDSFWIQGNSQITALQQMDFLRRLYTYKLPFTGRTIDIVKEIMINETGNDYILRGKTGWAHSENAEDVGWFIGWLEQNSNVYFFVCNIAGNQEHAADFANARKAITCDILREAGLMETTVKSE
jgi:beta-lactamase class D